MDAGDAGRGLLERARDDADGPTMDALLARLEALTARLDHLEAENAVQARTIARLEARADQTRRPPASTHETKVGRRGMLRKVLGATAAAALLTVAKEGTPARAETRTTLTAGGASTGNYGLAATAGVGFDPAGWMPNLNGLGFGVIGTLDNSGIAAPVHAGVFGSGDFHSGVLGLSNSGFGVIGQSKSHFGVHGLSTASNAAGVGGVNQTFRGVWGLSTSGYGVYGESTSGIGVYGQSTNSYGCGGATSKPGFAGLFGYAGVASAAGFLGVNAAPGGTAGYFHGAVTVDGPFQVVNGPKNALVAHPDGSHRRMYCQESPEPWFEDFGTAQLQGGKATVRLDPDFAALVKADQYSIVPIPEGECKGLYVTVKTPVSFEVRELQGGASSIPFSYRLVARRKDDVGKRLEKVDLPKFDLRPPGSPITPPGQDKQPPR